MMSQKLISKTLHVDYCSLSCLESRLTIISDWVDVRSVVFTVLFIFKLLVVVLNNKLKFGEESKKSIGKECYAEGAFLEQYLSKYRL